MINSIINYFSGAPDSFSAAGENYFQKENKKIIIAPVQIIAALTIVAGIYALLFELRFYESFQFQIYWGRLLATVIGFAVLTATFFDSGKRHPEILVHILLLSIILSFVSIIIIIPKTLFINSQILALIIFTSALFLSWDIKNQIIVAIYYNALFAFSIFLSDQSIFVLPNLFGTVIFLMFVSVMSVVANAINFFQRRKVFKKTLEAKQIFDDSSEGLFRLNSNGELALFNKSFIDILSLPGNTDKGIKENFSKIFYDINKNYSVLETAEKNGKVENLRIELKNEKERRIILNLNLRVKFNSKNKISYFDGSIVDITKNIEAEEKIRNYTAKLEELNAEKDKFFSIVSHDLKSPFTALLGYSELLVRESKKDGEGQIFEYSKVINSVTKEAFHLLENLLNWSRIQTGRMKYEPQRLELFSLVNDVIAINRNPASISGVSIENNIPPGIFVFVDVDMLQIIMNNLISNAVRFNKNNGWVKINAETKDGFVLVSVQDSGVGMSEKDLDNLFKIGIHKTQIGRTTNGGSGLGLIITADLVKRIGGGIRVSSAPDNGSTFSITIPKAEN